MANALKDDDEHYHAFRDILLDMRFMPAGRVQAGHGVFKEDYGLQLLCLWHDHDSFVEDEGHIMQRATEAAATMRMGGGIGYDFSPLRPKGALIRSLESQASGPVSFMDIFNSICKTMLQLDIEEALKWGCLE